jgi:transcription elongation factor GreA
MTHYITQTGLEDLIKEAEQLKNVDLPEILDAINKAMAEGDISENAPLEAAKEDRDTINLRINEIDEILSDYQIIDEASASTSKTVKLGSHIKVQYAEDLRTFELMIVGSSEADALNNRISNESPLAIALIGKKAGDEVSFKSKNKEYKVKILDIMI